MSTGDRQCRVCGVREATEKDDGGVPKYCTGCYAKMEAAPFLERIRAIAS